MFKVVAKSFVYEDKVDEVLKLYEELVSETQKETGCISYNLYQDINDRTVLTMLEEWENMECFNNHINSAHYKKLIPEISKFRKSSEINKYELVV